MTLLNPARALQSLSLDCVARDSLPIDALGLSPLHTLGTLAFDSLTLGASRLNTLGPLRALALDALHLGTLSPLRTLALGALHLRTLDTLRTLALDALHLGTLDTLRTLALDALHLGTLSSLRALAFGSLRLGALRFLRTLRRPVLTVSTLGLRRSSDCYRSDGGDQEFLGHDNSLIDLAVFYQKTDVYSMNGDEMTLSIAPISARNWLAWARAIAHTCRRNLAVDGNDRASGSACTAELIAPASNECSAAICLVI